MITKEDVKKMAVLARIKLDAKEEKELAGELESILGYIEKLKEINIEGIQETSHVFHSNSFRQDEPMTKYSDAANLIDAAPETERGFIKVKKIFNDQD